MLTNPLAVKFIGSLLRWVIGPVSALLVAKGVITSEDAGQYSGALSDPGFITGAMGFLAQLGWSLWEKYTARQKLVTALAAPTPTTEQVVELIVKAGEAPSTTTPKDEVPTSPPAPAAPPLSGD